MAYVEGVPTGMNHATSKLVQVVQIAWTIEHIIATHQERDTGLRSTWPH